MKKYIMTILVLPVLLESLLFPGAAIAQETTEQKDFFYRAEILEILSEDYVIDFVQSTLVEEARAELLEGPKEGETVVITNEVPEGTPGRARLEVGDKVIVGYTQIGGEDTYFLSDRYRLPTLYLLIGLFVFVVFLATGKRTIHSLFGLGISFLIIVYYIVPAIAQGQNPTFVALVGTLIIATLSIFVAHGFYARTAIAFVSTVATIFLALGLSSLAVIGLDLFGSGTEEAFFLQYSNGRIFNLQGILIAGITIGVLGVLDDVTTAQAAVVEQLYRTDKTLGFLALYKKGAAVGHEHIISLVNTIALAYTGASLPLLLMFEHHERPAWLIVNSELIMEEVVRIVVGSIVLVLAVPITTALAAYYYAIKKPYLSDDGGHAHTHSH